ncbi:hypothetical protein RYB03_28870, partial [Pseudomonas syringae pv. actinidiae]|nr:hypothetical protein [Pseudomonas syringae pv. actinidiae]
ATSLGLLLRMAEPCGQQILSVDANILSLKADISAGFGLCYILARTSSSLTGWFCSRWGMVTAIPQHLLS